MLSMVGAWGWNLFLLGFLVSRFGKGEIQTAGQWGSVIFILIWSLGFASGITFLLVGWIKRGYQNKRYFGNAKKIAFLD